MKPPPRACLLAAVAATLLAQQPADPTERLAKARALLVARASRLPDYTCVQTVDRQYFTHLHPQTPHTQPTCATITAENQRKGHNPTLASTDRLRLDVKVSHGNEIGTWAGASQFGSRSVFDLIGGGPYGTGMLGTLIGDTFENGGATYQYLGEDTTNGTRLAAYSFQVPVDSSHYRVKACFCDTPSASPGRDWTTTPFSGVFWLDPDTLELRRLTVQASHLSPETGICEAVTTIDYQKVPVGTGEFLLPRQSVIRVVSRDANESQSTAVYSGCREYLGEAAIRFDDAPAEELAKEKLPAIPVTAAPLPAGISFSLALTSPIDTDTAAAGDIVTAKLRKPIGTSDEVLAPAGAMVQGRIVQMQHTLRWPRHFTIAIRLEKLEVGGVSRPLYAIGDAPAWKSPLVAAFEFRTSRSHYVVPAGDESNWVTVAPPPEERK